MVDLFALLPLSVGFLSFTSTARIKILHDLTQQNVTFKQGLNLAIRPNYFFIKSISDNCKKQVMHKDIRKNVYFRI